MPELLNERSAWRTGPGVEVGVYGFGAGVGYGGGVRVWAGWYVQGRGLCRYYEVGGIVLLFR